ncbi:MAG: hypothetical protein ACYC3I_14930 [Gemmataceae bacterium]
MAENGRRNREDALLLALASGQTIRDAAQTAGVAERTATRRMADAAFRRRLDELRADMVRRALGKMADGMADAADRLRQLLDANSEAVQLGACRVHSDRITTDEPSGSSAGSLAAAKGTWAGECRRGGDARRLQGAPAFRPGLRGALAQVHRVVGAEATS